jgi:hypothetical protein
VPRSVWPEQRKHVGCRDVDEAGYHS